MFLRVLPTEQPAKPTEQGNQNSVRGQGKVETQGVRNVKLHPHIIIMRRTN